MIQNKKIQLLEIWKNELFGEFSISEIMNLSRKKTKPWVFNALKLLVKNKILNSKRKGNLDIYSLNLDNPSAIQFLQYLELQENSNFSQMELISEIIKRVKIKNYSLIVFGSYAKNKQSKDSDIDICFLVENKEMEKKMCPYVNELKLDYSIKIDKHYITFEEFVKMLLSDEENLGKQIFRNHKVFYNPDIYYQLIKEAYKHGFRQ